MLGAGVRLWQEDTAEGAALYFLDPDGHKLEIHASDLASRIVTDQGDPPPGMRFY